MFWMGTQANYSSSIHYLLNFFILFLFFINSSLILDRQQLRPSFSMRLDTRFWCCICIFLLLFLFFLLRSARMLSVSGRVYGTQYLFNQQNKRWTVIFSGSRILFTRLTNIFFSPKFH